MSRCWATPAHPMLPMMAQEVRKSIEDGAALATLHRGHARRHHERAGALGAVRKPRATKLQQASAANRSRFHLPDGEAQRARDEALATSGDRSIANIGWLLTA